MEQAEALVIERMSIEEAVNILATTTTRLVGFAFIYLL
jgi:hypothetical protein